MVTFRDFMEASLYDVRDGFYARRTPREDFYTAPELHPAFAKILAAEISARLRAVTARRPASPLFIVEVGSGDGTLARQLLASLKEDHLHWFKRTRYVLVERVERLLLDSITSLHDLGARLLGYTRLREMPPFCGVVYSNELFDAMPVHVLEKRGGVVREVYVDGVGGDRSVRLGLLSRRELVHIARSLAPHMQEGGRHAVNLEMKDWIHRAAGLLECGSVITVDYGKRFSPCAPNPPRAYERHAVGSGIAARPGRRDITASVDFESLIREGVKAGLRTSSFETLGRFLLDRGIAYMLPEGSGREAFQERIRMKTLFHPEGMGEAFKVLTQEKGLS